MNEVSETVEQLARTVAKLEQRVSTLEAVAHPQPSTAFPAAAPPMPALSPFSAVETKELMPKTGAFSVLGRAMLAIAGAYLLRAMVESASVPTIPVITVAILYAFVWLIPATRAAAHDWYASAIWAGTSALILLPMLWELTLRFRLLPAFVTAGVLGAFAIAASALAWKHHFATVVWGIHSATSLAALVLAFATSDPAPFLIALFLIAFLGETAAACQRTLRVRPLVAAAADFAVFALIWIYSGPSGDHAQYTPLSAVALLLFGPALLLIYAASATAQTILLRRRISFFETAQTFIAFLLAVWGIYSFWSGRGAIVLGIVCLLASVAGYAVTFAWFSCVDAQRNYHVYATGSLALLLAGCLLCLPHAGATLALILCAILATLLGVYTNRITLEFHGLACLVTAAFSSGVPVRVAHAMVGTFPASPGWRVYLVSASSFICYLAVARSRHQPGDRWWIRLLSVLAAALATCAAAALLVWALVGLLGVAVHLESSHIAVIRTLVLCAGAMALAWGGITWQRRELAWMAWAALAFGASKLVFEDLRHGHLAFTAMSLFLYAITLMLLPRLMRRTPGARNSANERLG